MPPATAEQGAPGATRWQGGEAVGPRRLRLRLKDAGRITEQSWEPRLSCVIGRGDPERGPVEIDLSSVRGADYLSHRQAKVYPDARGWLLADLASTNGTWLDGERVQGARRLRDGDIIAFGMTKLLVKIDDE
jgi:pSer/pThr/pTyr-binding forkhead associated (FHA) protein